MEIEENNKSSSRFDFDKENLSENAVSLRQSSIHQKDSQHTQVEYKNGGKYLNESDSEPYRHPFEYVPRYNN